MINYFIISQNFGAPPSPTFKSNDIFTRQYNAGLPIVIYKYITFDTYERFKGVDLKNKTKIWSGFRSVKSGKL